MSFPSGTKGMGRLAVLPNDDSVIIGVAPQDDEGDELPPQRIGLDGRSREVADTGRSSAAPTASRGG